MQTQTEPSLTQNVPMSGPLPSEAGVIPDRLRETEPQWARVRRMYAVNALSLTGIGLAHVLAPDFTRGLLYRGKRSDPLFFGLVGAVWCSMGALSALGWRNPRPFLGVLALQALYKSLSLAAVVPRALKAGDRDAIRAFGVLGAWLAGVLYSLPFRELAARR